MKNAIALCISALMCLVLAPAAVDAQVHFNKRTSMPEDRVGVRRPPSAPAASCDDEGDDGAGTTLECGITKALADLEGSVSTLTLWGSFCEDAAVSIGRENGELESLTVLGASDTSITAALGAGGTGTFAVMVECPCETCVMDVAIGAVGPTGPQGPPGPAGIQGSTGPLDLYVDSTIGDDANDGLTPNTAKRTIQAALNAIPASIGGEVTVHIQPGIYEEQTWVTPRARTVVAWITLLGEGTAGAPVIMDGTNLPENPGIGLIVSDPAVIATNITFQNYDLESAVNVLNGGGLEITNCRFLSNDGGSYSALDVDGGRANIEDCEFIGNNRAVLSEKSGHVRFFDNVGSVFRDNVLGLLAEENSSIKIWDGACDMMNSPMLARDHSTIRGYGRCVRDAASTCTIDDPSARCVDN